MTNESKGEAMKKQVVKYNVTDKEIANLKEEFQVIPHSLDRKEDYEFVRKGIAKIRTLRTTLEKKRKELKADALAWGKLVDGEAKRIRQELESIEQPMVDAKKKHDDAIEAEKERMRQAELARVEAIHQKMEAFSLSVDVVHASSSTLTKKRSEIEEIIVDESFEEFKGQAEFKKTCCLDDLAKLIQAAKDREAKEAEEKRVLAEQEEKRKAEDERRRQEQKELDRQRAEFEAEKAKLREQKEAEERAKQEEARKRAETERLEREKEAQERMKRESAERSKKVKNQIVSSLTRITNDEVLSIDLFDAIRTGGIPHVSILVDIDQIHG